MLRKMFKKISVITICLLALQLVSFGLGIGTRSALAFGPNIYVNAAMTDDTGNGLTPATAKKYIQSGIDIAVSGDKINVAAGTYDEKIIVDESVGIVGADKTSTIIDGGGSGIVVEITTNNVSFEQFTVKESGKTGTEAGIALNGVSGSTIKNNIVTNNFVGVALMGAVTNTVQNNLLTSNYFGIYLGDGTNHSTTNNILGNDISSSIYTNMGGTIYTGDGIYADKDCNGNTYTDNNVHGNGQNGFYFWKSAGNTVSGNTSSDNASSGFELFGSANNSFTDNSVNANLYGVKIRYSDDTYPATPNNITENDISGNITKNMNAENEVTSVNAVNNWWGDSLLATVSSSISGNVTFKPYYINPTMTILSNIKTLDSFNISNLNPIVNGMINEASKTVTLTVPFGTDLKTLVPEITITGSSVAPISGIATDFSLPQVYTVTSVDEESSQAYTIAVTVSPAPIPDTVKNFLVTIDATGNVLLTWTNPQAGTYSGLQILRDGAPLISLDPNTTAFIDLTAEKGKTYFYQIAVYNSSSSMAISTPAYVSVPVPVSNLIASAGISDSQEITTSAASDKKDVKGDIKIDLNKSKDEEKKDSLPWWGILLLIVLVLVGAYLLFTQRPKNEPPKPAPMTTKPKTTANKTTKKTLKK